MTDEIVLTRESLLRQREAYLMIVDDIERQLQMSPRTAELRKIVRENIQKKETVVIST